METSIILTIQYFLVAIFIHVIICRISPSRFMFKGLTLGLLTVIVCIYFQIENNRIDLVSIYLLGTGWLAYLMFFINLLNSVTLKMLQALSDSNEGILLNSDFDIFFSEENGLQSRVSSMIENGFLKQKGSELKLTSRSLFMVFWVNLLRNIFSMNEQGK